MATNWSKYLLKIIDLPQTQTKMKKEIQSNTLEAFSHSRLIQPQIRRFVSHTRELEISEAMKVDFSE